MCKRMKALKSEIRAQVDPQMVTLFGEAAIWILNPAEVALAVTIARQDLSDTQGFERAAKAAEALGLLGGAAKLAVPSLTQALARAAEVTIKTSEPDRRWATRLAIHATETLSNFGSVDLLLVHQLGRALRNSDANLRKEAARACFVMRPPEVKLPVPLSKLIRKHAHPQRMGKAQALREEQGRAFAQVVALQVCTLRPSLLLAGFPELSAHGIHIQSNLTELCQDLCMKYEEYEELDASDVQALISWQKEVLLPLDSIEIMGNMFAALQSALLDAFVGEASFDFRKVIAEGFVGWGAPFVAGAMLRIQQICVDVIASGRAMGSVPVVSACCCSAKDGLAVGAAGGAEKHSAFGDVVRDDGGLPPSQKKYQISIQKKDANEQLGMDVKHRLGRLVVLAIHRGGAVDRANVVANDQELPEMKVNDVIVDVNGATLDTTMVAACKSSAVLRVTFTRREHHW